MILESYLKDAYTVARQNGLRLKYIWRADERGIEIPIVGVNRRGQLVAIWMPTRQRLEFPSTGHVVTAPEIEDVIEKTWRYLHTGG